MTSEPVRLVFQSLPFGAAEGPPLRIPPRGLMGPQTLKESLELALELGDGHRLEYRLLHASGSSRGSFGPAKRGYGRSECHTRSVTPQSQVQVRSR